MTSTAVPNVVFVLMNVSSSSPWRRRSGNGRIGSVVGFLDKAPGA